jgi:hypothetical protein
MYICGDRRSLRLQAEPGQALTLRAAPVVRNITLRDGVAPVSTVVATDDTPARTRDEGSRRWLSWISRG